VSGLQSVLIEWNLRRVSRVVVSAIAVFLALRLTDGFVLGLGVAVVLAILLEIRWWLHRRYVAQNE